MKRKDTKSRCPINFTLEIFGDPWSFLIYRGMVSYNARRFGDFLKSEERVGTSTLAERLVHLENSGVITKRTDEDDRRKVVYSLTEIGIDALAMFYEISAWGVRTSPDPKVADSWLEALSLDREVVLGAWRGALKSGSAFYVGDNSVVKQLGLGQAVAV